MQHQPVDRDIAGIYRSKRDGVTPAIQLDWSLRIPCAGPVDEDLYGSTSIHSHCKMFTR